MNFRMVLVFGLFIFANSLIAWANPLELKSFTTKNFLTNTAPTGCMPKGMKIDPVGNSLYVAEMCGKIDPISKKRVPSASIYNMDTKSLSKTLITPVGMRAGGILANTEVEFSLDEQWALITRAEGDSHSEVFKNFGLLTVVDTESQKIAKYIPLKGSGSKIVAVRPFIAEDPKRTQIVYVANYFSDDISVVDVTNLRANGNLDGSAHFKNLIPLHTSFRNPESHGYFIAPRGIAFTPDGKYALILATETGSIIIIDSVNHKQIAELAPIDAKSVGRELNVRHIVITKNGQMAYLSHMRGNAVSRINLTKLIEIINNLPTRGNSTILPSSIWDELLIPFNLPSGPEKILVLEDYPMDHPNFPGKKWDLAHPNTIVLDPINNNYLYVSSRTTSDKDINKVDPKIMGKIDIIDIVNDRIVYTLVGGAQPTALEVSRDGSTLISSGFINDKLYFYDLRKILNLYEKI